MNRVTYERYSVEHPWRAGRVQCELVSPAVHCDEAAPVVSIGNGYGAGIEEMRTLAVHLATRLHRPVQTYDDPRVEAALLDPLEFRRQTREVVLRSLGDRSVTLLGWSTGGLVDTWVARDHIDPESPTHDELRIAAKMTLGMAGVVNFQRPLKLARQGSFEVLRAPLRRIDAHVARVAMVNSARYFGSATKIKLAAREVEQLSRISVTDDIQQIIRSGAFPYKAVTFEYDGIFPASVSRQIFHEAGIGSAYHTVLRGFSHIDLAWRTEAMERVAYLLEDLELQRDADDLGDAINL